MEQQGHSAAFGRLREHLASYVKLDDATFHESSRLFSHKVLRKTHFLFQEGEVCPNMAFVVDGCMRLFSVDPEGREHIVQFGFDGWWISDLMSFLTREPSVYQIDALERSELLLLDRDGYDQLCGSHPEFDRFFRLLLQNHHIASHRRIRNSLSMSAEEKYLSLIKTYPDIEQRIAQRHIASFLGMTPESLSRIRRHLAESGSNRP